MKIASFLDPLITPAVFGLIGISLFIIGSTSPVLFLQQVTFFVVGLALFILFTSINKEFLSKFYFIIYMVTLLLLFMTLFGPEVRGASRWLEIGGARIQPSELLKPFMIVAFASFTHKKKVYSLRTLIYKIMLFIPIFVLIMRQPDLGNAIVYLSIFVILEIAS